MSRDAEKTSHSTLILRKISSDALAGVVGSLVALWTFYPLDVYKTHLQASRRRRDTLSKCSNSPIENNTNSHLEQRSSEKFKSLPLSFFFRGILAKSIHTMASSFCYFSIHSAVTTLYERSSLQRQGKPTSAVTRLFLSAIAAMMNTLFTLPLDVIASKQQVNGEHSSLVDGTSNETKDTTHEESPWNGLLPSLLLSSNPAIHYTVYDSVKSRLRRHTQRPLSMREAFMVGMLAKLVATLATYPLIRAKVMLMVLSNKETAQNSIASLIQCLKDNYNRDGGIQGLYKGCDLQILHTILKTALLMMVREHIHRAIHHVIMAD